MTAETTGHFDGLVNGLNPAQREAVTYAAGPLLVLAGAGSGKTSVLTKKIAYKLAQGVLPPEILAVTFTNKAAKEMKARITTLVGDSTARGLWIGTFHSICARWLRQYIGYYQSPSGCRWTGQFVIADESESIAAMKAAIATQNLDEKLYVPKTMKYMVSELKNSLIDAYTYASKATDFKTERLSQIYAAYEAELARNNMLDFDDLLMLAVLLFRQQPAVLAQYHAQFKHILVDEFQDTNGAQYALIRQLADGPPADLTTGLAGVSGEQRSLTVVGDVDQSIYSWRGADFRICLNFQTDYPTAGMIKLLDNYRSTASILTVANTIIEQNSERLPKELRPVKGKGEPVFCYEASDDRDEAHFVLERVLDLHHRQGVPLSHCAVLYRTNSQSRSLEDTLIARGVPYTIIGGLKFYDRKEIKDVLAYLTVIFNDQDGYSVKRIVNVPARGIGKTTFEKLETQARAENISLYALMREVTRVEGLRKNTLAAIQNFVGIVERLKQQATTLPLDELMVAIIEQTGMREAMIAEDPSDNDGRLGNLDELVNVARQFMEDNEENGLVDFLTQMALLSDLDSADTPQDRLVMMTLHAAKGLEYPVVFLVGLEEGLFPHMRALNDKDGMEEERRLMYVGVTRAEDRLFLTYARRRMTFGDVKFSMPSRFLKEIPPECLTGSYSLDGGAGGNHGGYGAKHMGAAKRNAGNDTGSSDWSSGDDTGDNDWSSSRLGSSAPRTTGPSIRMGGGQAVASAARAAASQATQSASPPRSLTDAKMQFNEGDRLKHPRFGLGTVEQVITAEGKRLYNIQFDTIEGKKLLDPRYVALEKV